MNPWAVRDRALEVIAGARAKRDEAKKKLDQAQNEYDGACEEIAEAWVGLDLALDKIDKALAARRSGRSRALRCP